MAENAVEKKRGAPSAKRATVKKNVAPAKAVASPKVEKKDKIKVVSDFSIPQAEYVKLVELKQTCLKAGMPVKKKELLRAGLHALGKLSVPQLKQVLSPVVQSRAGRPQQKNTKPALSE